MISVDQRVKTLITRMLRISLIDQWPIKGLDEELSAVPATAADARPIQSFQRFNGQSSVLALQTVVEQFTSPYYSRSKTLPEVMTSVDFQRLH